MCLMHAFPGSLGTFSNLQQNTRACTCSCERLDVLFLDLPFIHVDSPFFFFFFYAHDCVSALDRSLANRCCHDANRCCHDAATRIKPEADHRTCKSLCVAELPFDDVLGLHLPAWSVSKSSARVQVAQDWDSYGGLVRNHDDVSSSGFCIEGFDVASCAVAWKSAGTYSLQLAV